MIEVIAITLIVISLGFLLIGALGVYRFEDAYLRLQASSKALTMGLGFLLPGAALLIGGADVMMKALLAVLFQFLTAPIAAHMVARSAWRRGLKPVKVEQVITVSGEREILPGEDPTDPANE